MTACFFFWFLSCDLVAVIGAAAIQNPPPPPPADRLVIEISDSDDDGDSEQTDSDIDTDDGDTDHIHTLKRTYRELVESRKRMKTAVVTQYHVESMSVAALYVAILSSAACSAFGRVCGCHTCGGVYHQKTAKCRGVLQHDMCPGAYLRSVCAAIDDGKLEPSVCPIDPGACVCTVPDPEVAQYEHPDRFSVRMRSLAASEETPEETIGFYIKRYTHLYSTWESESTEIRGKVETNLRALADETYTPCCHLSFFYDGCSAVRCIKCQISFCGICHKMYKDDNVCHDHVRICASAHARIHNTGPNLTGVFVSEENQNKYLGTTRAHMICRYAVTQDWAILGVGGIIRWNNLVRSVLGAMLCSGNPNQRLVDKLGITNRMLSAFYT